MPISLCRGEVCAWPSAVYTVVWCRLQIKPAHDVATGEPRDEKAEPRPLRGVPAARGVTKGRRFSTDRFVRPV